MQNCWQMYDSLTQLHMECLKILLTLSKKSLTTTFKNTTLLQRVSTKCPKNLFENIYYLVSILILDSYYSMSRNLL